MTRSDLLAVTPETLIAIANAGLVKRAAKDLDAGLVPSLRVDPDGTVLGTFPDGSRVVLPPGHGPRAATCSCGAPGSCRHRIGLVLAYQRTYGGPAAPPVTSWSPGVFDDDALRAAVGSRAVTAARLALAAGYLARIHRPTAGDAVPSVDLPSCTVRFLVPGELGYADTDAAAVIRGEVIAQAVWAFRAADESGLPGENIELHVGGAGRDARHRPAGRRTGPDTSGPAGLEAAISMVNGLLLDGAVHAGPLRAAAVRRAAANLAAGGLPWPAGVLEDLARQLDRYGDRGAGYEAERFAALLAEMHARQRAATALPEQRARVLGSDEPGHTPLRRVRLVALGCRISGDGTERMAEVYFAEAGAGIGLVLRRRWTLAEGTALTGYDLAARRIAGVPLGTLATANVVSESASRSASRVVQIARSQVGKTTVTPAPGAWRGLPGTLLVKDLAAFGRSLDGLPPRLVRPRIEAESVRVVEIAEVRRIGYHPGAQLLVAQIVDPSGTAATVTAEHQACCPGALEALATALANGPSLISGFVWRAQGAFAIKPLAVRTGSGIVVPDLAAGDGSTALEEMRGDQPDPLTEALERAVAVLAEAAHRGLRHLSPDFLTRLDDTSAALRTAGLRNAGAAVTTLTASVRSDDLSLMTRTWTDAQIQLLVSLELR